MTDEDRSIELEIEVPGTPEQVWEAIATGPGVSSWYVPHTIEEREGGELTASFGEGPEMTVAGKVQVWDPPHRAVFDNGESAGLAFEWLVEARDGTCIVRLVNSGFAPGSEWEDHYDGMEQGWKLFLRHLKLHLEKFAPETAVATLPMAPWEGPAGVAWKRLQEDLGIDSSVAVGERIDCETTLGAAFAGTVAHIDPTCLSVVLDKPLSGTAFMAVEGAGDQVMVSVWSYLYGADAPEFAREQSATWQAWLSQRMPKSD